MQRQDAVTVAGRLVGRELRPGLPQLGSVTVVFAALAIIVVVSLATGRRRRGAAPVVVDGGTSPVSLGRPALVAALVLGTGWLYPLLPALLGALAWVTAARGRWM